MGVYDDKADPAQVAALRLRYVLLGEGFPAVAVAVGSFALLDLKHADKARLNPRSFRARRKQKAKPHPTAWYDLPSSG